MKEVSKIDGNSKSDSVDEDSLSERVYGNDWRVLKPAEIGEGDFVDQVTVILPCYMGQQELALTFAGLSIQTYPHHLLEVIIVDDGSDPPIKLPSELPFETSIAVQERDGFGLARARNLGAEKAKGEILIFLDCDMIPEPQLVEAHARWHHANKFALTLGFRSHADFLGVSPEELISSTDIASSIAGRKVTTPQWIEFHMARTKNLTSADTDLFRIATGGNLGVRKSFFESTGGFDASFKQWGGEDIEFGFRAFNLGGILVPERKAKAWHQGEGASPDPSEEISLEQQRHRLSHLIPEKTFRDSAPGRNFEVPMLAVSVDATNQTFEEVCAQVDSVLASSFYDLVIGLDIPESKAEKISLERRYGPDPRVTVTSDIFSEFPFTAFFLEVPSGFCLALDHIEYLMNHIDDQGVLIADILNWGEIRLAKSRALWRSKQIGIFDVWEGASLLFGEKVVSAENLGITENYGKKITSPSPLGNPPLSRLMVKVIRKVFAVRSFSDFLKFIEWVFFGLRNVFRRSKPFKKLMSFGKKHLKKEPSFVVPDWIRIAGKGSYFPDLRPWRGNGKGVEVILVTPDAEQKWDNSAGRSVILGSGTGIPLAPPFNPEIFNPSSFRQAKQGSRIENLSDFKVDRNFIKRTNSALAIEVDRVDSIESAKRILQLTATGVPVFVKELSGAELWLGKSLVSALREISLEDLIDPTEREKVSVKVRRATFRDHTVSERLKQIRKAAGLVTFKNAMVSVVIATKRPEMVEHILQTVKAQDYDNFELILALHGDGFDNSFGSFSSEDFQVTVLHFPSDRIFGSVLSEASAIAKGEWIAKMDDDDWYGCEHISDLILASQYSNADLVGKGSEFVYLMGQNKTIRRDLGASEVPSRTLAGGTLLVRSALLKKTYGWRELSKGVDVALINEVVSAGGSIWRTHPFGYLLRRTEGQHTWEVDDSYFLRRADQLWDGAAFDLVGVIESE